MVSSVGILRGAAGLLVVGALTASLSQAPGAEERKNRRPAPIQCQQLVSAFSVGLRETQRRLEHTSDRPDAERRQSAILAWALERPANADDLSKLLACLAGE